jgi:hypothetical protein
MDFLGTKNNSLYTIRGSDSILLLSYCHERHCQRGHVTRLGYVDQIWVLCRDRDDCGQNSTSTRVVKHRFNIVFVQNKGIWTNKRYPIVCTRYSVLLS